MTSGIEWTEDTWNPLTGCSIASAGCTNCYAAREAAGRLSSHAAYKGLAVRNATTGVPEFTGEVRLLPERLRQPIAWQRPRLVFVNSMSDLFHPNVPTDYIAQVYAIMALAKRHVFQLLTKRPKRRQLLLALPAFQQMVEHHVFLAPSLHGATAAPFSWPLPNVWEGVSVEDQANAWRLNVLASTPAAVRWVSVEPLLSPVTLLYPDITERPPTGLDWVVVGGESGPGARPMHPDWARTLRDECAATGTPFLFKQWGDWAPDPDDALGGERVLALHAGGYARKGEQVWLDQRLTGAPMARTGKKAAGRLLDGVQHDGYPAQWTMEVRT